jgi:sugar lactone lactonase YvrE
MAEERLRRNLDRAFDPGPDFPNRLLLSRTMAMLASVRPEWRRPIRFPALPRTAGQLVAAALVLLLVVAAFDVFQALREYSRRSVRQAGSPCLQSSSSARKPGHIYTVVGCGSRGVTISDGVLATAALLSQPDSLAFDQAGNLYFSDLAENRVFKVSASGVVTTVAGNGTPGFSGDGGRATAAQINAPGGITFDRAGNLYIAESGGNRVRKVSLQGVITTVAGTGTTGYAGDGRSATETQLVNPYGVAFDSAGNLYIAELDNNRVRRVDPRGVISTVAGGGSSVLGDGGPAVAARLSGPVRVFVDRMDNIYIADAFNFRVRKVSPAGIITTVAGNGASDSDGDGGPAVMASINGPHGVAMDGAGNLYIADFRGHRIRKVSPDGIITTVVGTGDEGFSGDGGPAISAKIGSPSNVAVDSAGNLYILDPNNKRIREVVRPG